MMQFAHKPLSEVKGLQFYKLMGSGKGLGFNPYPDWTTYALLQIWDSEAAADAFFRDSRLIGRYREKSQEIWTIYMKSIMAHGAWSGGNPFQASEDLDPDNPLLCIITRATIKMSKLRSFWKYVPTSEKPLEGNKSLIFTKGIGEVPVIQMATFSIWENKEALREFAYKSPEHQKAIKMTRELDWYSEELFSRFQPFKSQGSWKGKNPLPMITDIEFAK